MQLVVTDNTGTACPHCGVYLAAEATWECDVNEPMPDQVCKCPACGNNVCVEQRVTTTLSAYNAKEKT